MIRKQPVRLGAASTNQDTYYFFLVFLGGAFNTGQLVLIGAAITNQALQSVLMVISLVVEWRGFCASRASDE